MLALPDPRSVPVNKPNTMTPNVAVPNAETRPNRVVAETPKKDATPAAVTTAPAPASSATTNPNASSLEVGSLIPYASKQAPPIYPAAAKTIRAAGVVRVEVTVSENGDVATVDKTSGPQLLQAAARDAVRKWKFRPFTRDGQPVKATGFVNFNFNL